MYSDRSEPDLSDETLSKIKIFVPVESYDEKNAEKYRNCYIAEKRIISKLSNISIPNLNS